MAFIHCGSEECTKSELDLFQIAPTQTSIENSFYVEMPPLATLMVNVPLEFFILGHGDHYLDGNNMLSYTCCKEVKEDGSGIDDDARVALTNYPIATFFNQMDVTLGDCLISQSNNCYPYRALIELILNYSHDILTVQISAGGFHKDTAGAHESTILDGTGKKGFMHRARLMASSRKLDLLGPLHSDLFSQEKLLLNGVDLKIKLTRSKAVFCLMSGNANQNDKVHIISESLFVKRVTVTPGVCLGHTEALMAASAKYPVDRVGIKVFSIPAGSRVSNQENLFWGQLPKQLVIAFIDNDAFSGSYIKNPLNVTILILWPCMWMVNRCRRNPYNPILRMETA
nr:uncharacterized protein LOC101935889 [Chrysemys picta bellii]XP_042702049.1 uncharacterized protein LOC101935889 [Chrysemys picta bellii]